MTKDELEMKMPLHPEDREPEICEMPAPKCCNYESDVLVIGGGFSGLMAAVTAAENGCSVALVDTESLLAEKTAMHDLFQS